MAAALSRGTLRWIRRRAPKRAVWVCVQAARVPTPPPDMPDRQGVCCGMACSTFDVYSVIIAALSFSRQQDNTFARITGPHR
jgi:hypothetical protein